MKKHIKPLAAISLALSALLLASCTPSAKVQQKVKQHLTEQYGEEREFELVDYSQSKTTSGRYVVNMKCSTDGTEFQMFVSSTMISDGYGVTRVNDKMQKAIFDGIITDKTLSAQIESIEWLDRYKDGADNFLFREINPDKDYTVKDIRKLNSVILIDQTNISAAAGTVYDIFSAFKKNDVKLDDTVFYFVIDGMNYTMTCDCTTVLANTRSEFVQRAIVARDKITGDSFIVTKIDLEFIDK